MSCHNEEYKQQVYKKWIESGRPWFDIDPKKEPTYAERQIILEIKKPENTRANSDLELEKRPRPKNEIKKFDRLLRDGANY
jgi:hypothetical protein